MARQNKLIWALSVVSIQVPSWLVRLPRCPVRRGQSVLYSQYESAGTEFTSGR